MTGERGGYDVLTMGRVGVDVYPREVGVGLDRVETFGKYLGGSPTNVAVAAARHGRRSAVITRTGDDPFGRFVRRALGELGVDDRFVSTVPGLPTPVTFCEMFPPDDFPIYFYRWPKAPDLEIDAKDLDLAAIRRARVFWVTVTGLCAEPSRSATLAALEARGRRGITVLDLDYRPAFWSSREEARRWAQRALALATVAVGNEDECDVAVGEKDARAAAAALRARGVDLAVVKRGGEGVLGLDGDGAVAAAPHPVHVVNGLGAGDAFGGALCHGLLAGWPLESTLRFANVAGAIVASRIECSSAMPTTAEVEAMLSGAVSTTAVDPRKSVPHIVETRARRPGAIAEAAAARKKRASLAGESGRLFIVAADHPARGSLAARGRPHAMADRADLLERLCIALSRPGVDGVLATADVLEDLLLLGALDGKVVIGSMNRGGIAGAAFEIDDRFTACDAEQIARMGFDGGKMLLRIDPADRATPATLESCARAVGELAERGLMAMVEPFMSHRRDGRLENDLSPDAMVRAIAIASGLGRTSAHTWLKVPVVPEMQRVMATSTLPALLLGGEGGGDAASTAERFRDALRLPTVRGLVVGRTLLYPPGDDVASAVDAAAALMGGGR